MMLNPVITRKQLEGLALPAATGRRSFILREGSSSEDALVAAAASGDAEECVMILANAALPNAVQKGTTATHEVFPFHTM